MKDTVKVMQGMMENQTTGEKAPGCTILITGELKDILDQLMKENTDIKSYAQAVAVVMKMGIHTLEGNQ